MKTLLATLSALLLSAGAEAVDGNILMNGRLAADQADVPIWWEGDSARLLCEPASGPDGMPSVRFVADRSSDGATLRQFGLSLASNGLYRLSCRVKAGHFAVKQGKHAKYILAGRGWRRTAGLEIPEGTYGWTQLVCVVRAPCSSEHSAIVHLPAYAGALSVADLSVEPADALTAAATGRSEFLRVADDVRIVPVAPLLTEIPEESRMVRFRLFGEAGALKGASVFADGPGVGRTEISPEKGAFDLALPPAPDGGTFALTLSNVTTGVSLLRREYRYRTVTGVREPLRGRRLNRLVREFVRETVGSGETRNYAFALPHDGWVFLSATARSVALDGKPVALSKGPVPEAFRELTAGRHVLTVVESLGGEVVLRQVPELFDYRPGAGVIPEAALDWSFYERHALPSVTTVNKGPVPPDAVRRMREEGRLWLDNFGTGKVKGAGKDAFASSMLAHRGLTLPDRDGSTADEFFFSDVRVRSDYMEALRDLSVPKGKRIYTWIVGVPALPGFDLDFMSVAVNATEGRGKLLSEMYCRTCGTEAEAWSYLKGRLCDATRAYVRCMPALAPRLGVILGNFTQYPQISLLSHPEVDFRYFLDMQCNLIANDPAFEDLGCTGVWGSDYADEETRRWTYMLFRHYFIEGRTTMLSGNYGFAYIPRHLANGDFREGLDGWKPTGGVRSATRRGLGASEGRWYSNLGDDHAVLVREKDVVSGLSQKLTGLTVGQRYVLSFASFDATFPRRSKKRHAPDFGVDARFPSGARVVDGLSWKHRDVRGIPGRKESLLATYVNYRHLVFEALSTEAEIVLGNADAAVGSEIGINAVSVKRYLATGVGFQGMKAAVPGPSERMASCRLPSAGTCTIIRNRRKGES